LTGTRPLSLSTEKRFHEELVDLPRDAQKRIIRALSEMQQDPVHRSKQLEGVPGVWRREVAPYRILFTAGDGWIHAYSVQHRQGVYAGRIATPQHEPSSKPPRIPKLPGRLEELVESTFSAGQSRAEPVNEEGPSWGTVSRIIAAKTPDDLYELIDLGLPEELFDRLYGVLSEAATSRPDQSKNVWLIRKNVIDAFFGRLINLGQASHPSEVTMITPWITPWRGPKSSLAAFVRYVARRAVRTTIITRPPELVGHKQALAELSRLKTVEISYLPELHAKFFVCDVAPIPFTLVASANSTAQSFANFEVGVLVRGSGAAEGFVRDLQSLGTELLAIGTRIKRRGAK